MRSFPTYTGKGGALEFAEGLVPELHKGSKAAMLTPEQAGDAWSALEVLQGLKEATGKKFSLHEVASQFAEAARKLGEHSLAAAVAGFLGSVVTVSHIKVGVAIEQFAAHRKAKTVPANDGCSGTKTSCLGDKTPLTFCSLMSCELT
jgi:hypothetical protein